MVEMNIKNPNFLKQLPKEARKEAFKWAFYEERIILIRFPFKFRFLGRILMEHIESKDRSDSELQIDSKASVRIRSRKQDIV